MTEFLMNTWYAFAWSDELGQAPLGRTIAGKPIVCFRDGDGIGALEDTCPHRFVPLSMGTVSDGAVQCAYHGLRFGRDGKCVHNPLGPPPDRARVRSYSAVERHAMIWVWPGDPAKADPAGIADFAFLTDPARARVTGYAHVAADYQLAIDNLNDLTHIQFVHSDFQACEAYPRLSHETQQDENDAVYRTITLPDGAPAPFFAKLIEPQRNVDFTMITRWTLPSNIKLTARVTEANQPDAYILGNFSAHLVTPEVDGSCHYFYAHSRDYGVGDPDVDAKVAEWQRIGFSLQDKPILEAQQKRVGANDPMKMHPVILPTDVGGVRARRILTQRIARERSLAEVPAQSQSMHTE